MRYIKNTLRLNNYPPKFIKKFIRSRKKNISSGSSSSCSNTGVINNNLITNGNNGDKVKREFKASSVLPYEESTSEALQRILNKAGIKVALKPTNSHRNKLSRLKDPINAIKQNNLVLPDPLQ
ncbi:unnamed protein product [Heterobilharzia americana]|nr:unnamed protein product [Heterobilharzia americana]CAH8592378.1 unnamed protein product [Heterobilharzia americana]